VCFFFQEKEKERLKEHEDNEKLQEKYDALEYVFNLSIHIAFDLISWFF
jgi:hypothetical protein